ncbi:MAG TPA: tetratricopeptide repeat protein, partial [Candidatus Polarisedimenticolia bacterium]|nr:tetratricopeptide repeat protein [Candidatus Polarisedimenticolia bacterium]
EPVLLLRAARLYRSAGVPERGLEFLSSLGFQGRREAYRLAAIGSLYEESLSSREALDAYVASVRADPSVERALQGAYAILKREGRLDELAALLERGLSAESERVAVRAANWLALTREEQGRRDEARKILLDALGRSPDDLMTLTNLGAMLVREDRSREALPYLGRAYSVEPNSLEVLVNLIVAHAKVGRLAEARRFLGEGERLAAGAQLRPLLNAFAYACFLAGELEEAGRYVDRSLAMDPSQRDVLLLREEIGRKKAPPGL